MRIGGSGGLGRLAAVALVASFGCAGYNATTRATRTIYSVRVVTKASEVRDCRLLGRVNSRDESNCGLTVQPTPEECLRYQVRRAGGDTLLVNGPIGDAYDCSGGGAASTAAATAAPASAPPAAPPAAAPAPQPTAPPPAAKIEAPTPAPTPAPAAPAAEKRARVVRDRGAARGCVYVGDLDPKSACALDSGPNEDCLARAGAEAGADTVVWDGTGSAQVFRCEPTP